MTTLAEAFERERELMLLCMADRTDQELVDRLKEAKRELFRLTKERRGEPLPIVQYKSPATTTMGLGDFTESLLSSIGVTKDRYLEVKQLFNLAPSCNCEKRKEWLNQVSNWWRELVAPIGGE